MKNLYNIVVKFLHVNHLYLHKIKINYTFLLKNLPYYVYPPLYNDEK